jgi:hypothetical protein
MREDASPRAKGARRCTNKDCEFGGRWMSGGCASSRNGKFSWLGKGCHSVYEAREVIDPSSEDYSRYVGRPIAPS